VELALEKWSLLWSDFGSGIPGFLLVDLQLYSLFKKAKSFLA
jgi:hypothetical protein